MALPAGLAGDRRSGGGRGRRHCHALAGLRTPDPVVAEDYYRRGTEINRTLAGKGMLPAQAGRNHAATPVEDLPAMPKP